jgi:C4-dicarboxylate transporter DctM subunit
MSDLLNFLPFFVLLLVLLATGTPVAVATALAAAVGAIMFIGKGALSQLGVLLFAQASSFVLLMVPLFILMGEALGATRIGRDLFTAAQIWLWRVPGALPIGTIFSCAGFAAVCGSSPVTAATIGSVAVPEMIRKGYAARLAFGVTAAGGTLGIMIPPSVSFILYGIITETSIGALFMAGIGPGLMLVALLSLTVFYLIWRHPELAPPRSATIDTSERWTSLRSVLPVTLLIVAVLGSIYTGIATATEAAAVGALGALLIAFLLGSLKREVMNRILDNTARTTAMFVLLVATGLFSAFVLSRLGIPQATAQAITGLDVAPWVVMLAINGLLLILGMFLDPMSILVIVVPILFPAVVQLGYDPVWFGVMVTLQIEIAAISPPVGFNLFVLRTVVANARMADIIRGGLIFIAPMLIGIALLMIFPEIALFLPRMMDLK